MTNELHAPPVLLAVGQLFLDLVFADLPRPLQAGREIRAGSFVSGPGGIANQAVAARRLGAPTAIAAWVGDDHVGTQCLAALTAEDVDTAACRVLPGWAQPVTVAVAMDDDRALLTGGTPAPPVDGLFPTPLPAARVAIADLGSDGGAWVAAARLAGTDITATIGWDDAESWDPSALEPLAHCVAFVPNAEEAMRYTRCADPLSAARALAARVPLAVVTLGGSGVVAVDAAEGAEVHRSALAVRAVDPTGAGDVFCAAFAISAAAPWSLPERLDFAALVAAITVTRTGGAAAAPTAAALVPWLDANPGAAEPGRFDFVRRAFATDSPNPFLLPSLKS